MSRSVDFDQLRAQFPGLGREVAGRPAVFFDGPAGSQVPQTVIDAQVRYMTEANANGGGLFATSIENDRRLDEAHQAAADLFGCEDPDETIFGPNMTTLTSFLSRALARTWGAGDEILVTRLDHDANFTPWIQAARDAGATVHEVAFRHDDCTLDLDDFASKLSKRTRLVAFGAASNAVGTLNPVRELTEQAHACGAQVYVDAVHSAPHVPIAVEAWGADFVVCSAYKFFGPHVGMLWGRRGPLEQLPAYKLRPVSNALPDRWTSGTPNYEGIAGTLATIDYLAGIGREADPAAATRRQALTAAYRAIEQHERPLAREMLERLGRHPKVQVLGIRDLDRLDERVPTLSFTYEGRTPSEIAGYLAERGIFVWHGNFYAQALSESLGLEPHGMVRVGILHYNTADEVDRLCTALEALD